MDDHIAGDHIHMDITTCNNEEHNRSTFGTFSNTLLGVGVWRGLRNVLLGPNLTLCSGSKHLFHMKVS